MSKIDRNKNHFYPEREAGGFSRVDSAVQFYSRINALLEPSMHVLDFGAGRGAQLLTARSRYQQELLTIRGKVDRLVGVDIDPAVLSNPFLDEAKVIDYGSPLPFPNESFDLIFADWVLEHVENPQEFAASIWRLLKPGGWFCARTPNRWGLTGLATNLIPNQYHTKILRKLQPDRAEVDVFPTAYKLNTRSAIAKYFPRKEWNNFSYVMNAEPPYVSRYRILMRIVMLYWRLVPSYLYTNLFVFLQKR